MTEQENKTQELFDPADFRIPAKDLQGHQERCQFRAQPGHVNQVAVIVSSKVFPFRTKGDFYRYCLHQGLKMCQRLAKQLDGKSIPSVTSEVDAIIEIMRAEEFRIELEQVINRLSTLVTGMLGRNAESEARRLVLKIKRHIRQMPEGFWRDRYVSEINDRFGYLLDKVERASLIQLATGGDE